ncbi:tRNA methyltransferase complex GCD14 subunit [Dentipellis sp. KUC8613]|nr:tRNA methyltransferase complex GCD14 subunit [Dentipellis sp. KUC8613]
MWSSAREIAPGDVVIAWLTRDMIQPLVVTPGKDFNSRYGSYRHSDLVGLPYGSKVGSRNGKGFIHVLRPTPELWTLALPHRTQILYIADIAFITSWLDIRPGSHVIEAGTGSGSFTHSVARTIGPAGKLWSYEFHEERANKARAEFARHGMSDIVTLTHRNVCKDGFTVKDEVDAVFLDLPAPWEAVEHAKTALRKDRSGRICCFSPCMEQVLRTVSALNDAGFTEITMYETLLRPHEVSQVPALPHVNTVAEKIKQSERKREDKRLRQIANARARHTEKRKRDQDDAGIPDVAEEADVKRVKVDGQEQADEGSAGETSAVLPATQEAPDVAMDSATPPAPVSLTPPSPQATQVVSKIMPEVRGHTSYLTFARLLPMVTVEAAEADAQQDVQTVSNTSTTEAAPVQNSAS